MPPNLIQQEVAQSKTLDAALAWQVSVVNVSLADVPRRVGPQAPGSQGLSSSPGSATFLAAWL